MVTDVFLNQKKVNICEHTTKMASQGAFERCHQGVTRGMDGGKFKRKLFSLSLPDSCKLYFHVLIIWLFAYFSIADSYNSFNIVLWLHMSMSLHWLSDGHVLTANHEVADLIPKISILEIFLSGLGLEHSPLSVVRTVSIPIIIYSSIICWVNLALPLICLPLFSVPSFYLLINNSQTT